MDVWSTGPYNRFTNAGSSQCSITRPTFGYGSVSARHTCKSPAGVAIAKTTGRTRKWPPRIRRFRARDGARG